MPILLPNALLTVARPRYDAVTSSTLAPAQTLTGVLCHIIPVKASTLVTLPEAALKTQYQASVESLTDIATGDQVLRITLLDGVTSWPGDSPQTGMPGQDMTATWWVAFHQESTPGLLAYRVLFLVREIGNGPLHI